MSLTAMVAIASLFANITTPFLLFQFVVNLTGRGPQGTASKSGFHYGFKAAVSHALHIERHGFVHRVSDSLVLHHFGVYPIAVRPRLEHDVREDHRLTGLELGQLGKLDAPFIVEIVANAFLVIERAVLPPNFPRLRRHAA